MSHKSIITITAMLIVALSITISNASQDTMTVTPDGKVGIGINIPQHKLDVEGNISASNIIIKHNNQSVNSAAPVGSLTRDSNGNLLQEKSGKYIQVGSPIGSIIIWPKVQLPNGYLECNGQAIQRAQYPELVTMLTGSASAASTDLPDYRGEFLRGLDNGRGVDPESDRKINSFQDDSIKKHAHTGGKYSWRGNTEGYNGGYIKLNTGDLSNRKVSPLSVPSYGLDETRPRNMSVIFCIKAK